MQAITDGIVRIELVPIPAGDFIMGSGNEMYSEAPEHPVRFRAGFLLGRFPITQAQWTAVMGDNPSALGAEPDLPVDTVSFDHASEFCERLAGRTRCRVRLPSEAEWEYACRAGTTAEFFFGSWGPFLDDSEVPADVRRALGDFAWFEENSDGTRPVGCKRPNPWGLHDMLGNVWEWCADVWHADYAGAPDDGRPWLDGADHQPRRCLRGGAWDMNAFRCRSPYRSYDHHDLATNRFGFRVAVDG